MKYIEKHLLALARRSHLRIVLSVVILLTVGVQIAFFRSVDAVSTVPTTMNFQGRLTNSAGNIMADGLYNMKFRIYDAASAGTLKWSEIRETTNRVQVTNGLFSVQLGQVTPLDPTIFASGSLYFEIELPTPGTATCSTASCGTFTEGPMTPRNKLSTSAYAYNAETLDGLDSTDFIRNSTTIRSGNVAIQSAAAGNIGLQMRAATSQTADLAQFQDAAGNPMLIVDRFGRLTFGSTAAINGAGISLQTTDVNQQGMVVRGLNGQNVDLFDVQDYLGSNYFSVAGNGSTKVKVDSTAAFQVQSTGGTSALNVDTVANKVTVSDLVLSAGKTLTLTGGNTAGRPVSPTEGMVYYDTTTKQLLTYANGKWQSDSKTATFVVAASNSSQATKDGAQYVANGEDSAGSGIGTLDGDQIEINNALTAAGAAGGGIVYLSEGTYTIDAAISIPNNVTLAGSGSGTLIRLGNFGAAAVNINMITNTDQSTGAGVAIRDMQLDGRDSINTGGVYRGIYLPNVGASGRAGGDVLNMDIHDILYAGIYAYQTSNSTFVGNTIRGGYSGIDIASGYNNVVSGNIMQDNSSINIYIEFGTEHTTVTGNTMQGGSHGVYVDFSDNNTVSANSIRDAAQNAIYLTGSNQTIISSNRLRDSGGATTNDAIKINNSDLNTFTSNIITDTSATTNNYAINVASSTSDNNYLSGNTLGTGSVNDTGTGTRYANQLNASGQLINSAAGGLAVKLVTGSSSDLFQAQNASGTALMKVTSAGVIQSANFDALAAGALTLGSTTATSIVLSQNSSVASGKTFQTQGDTSVKVTSANAFQVQNAGGTALLAVDTSGGTVTVGSVTNGVVLSANGVTYAGTARSTNTITLSPEYAGATFTGDGTNNTGTLTSDFCSGSAAGGININAAACGGATSTTRNFYQWANTQATAQDYDVYVRYQIPSNYSTGSMTNLKILGWGDTTASESVVIAMYVDGTTAACSTSGNAVTANATWSSSTIASPLGSCTVNAGDMVTFKISLIAGQNKSARASAISFGYRGAF